MNPEPDPKIVRRLRCAPGHLNAVIEMTESGEPCEQVLHQLNAVQAALQTAGVRIIECQARSSQDIILNSTSITQRTAELRHLHSLYTIFVKQYSKERGQL
ncbi:MAG: metal-sensitive transcriptional regulator [Chloroflexota bacterium]